MWEFIGFVCILLCYVVCGDIEFVVEVFLVFLDLSWRLEDLIVIVMLYFFYGYVLWFDG